MKIKEIAVKATFKTTIGTVNDEELINVILSLKGKDYIRAYKLQVEFKKGYNWAFKVLDCLEHNSIVSNPDKYGDRKILVDDDFFDYEFLIIPDQKLTIMRIFHIRVNAKIKRRRWNDNDEPFFTEIDWDAELEIDGIESLEKLLDLNYAIDLKYINIPSFIISHIEFDDLDYDSINDKIIKLETKLIREIG
jgi:hypothetical protein